MTSAAIGHNSGLYVSDIGKLQAIDAVLKNTKFSQTEALILIGLIIRSDKSYCNAFPGAGTLAVYAKVAKTQTVFKALKNLEDTFHVVERSSRGSGRSNSYAVLPQRVVDAIVSEYDATKQAADATPTQSPEGGGSIEVPTLNGVASETHAVQGTGFASEPTPFKGLGANPNPPPSRDRLLSTQSPQGTATQSVQGTAYPFHYQNKKDQEEDDEPRNKFIPLSWDGVLNLDTHAADSVKLIDGKVSLLNGTRQKWVKEFGNDEKRLDLALIQITSFVQPNSRKPLIAQVEGQLARIAGEKHDRDQRYASAAKANKPAAAKPKLSRY